jgi:hypothetical protein
LGDPLLTAYCLVGHPDGVVKKKRAETLAELTARLPEPRPSGAWPTPISVGQLEYPPGSAWQLREADPKVQAVAREISRPDVLVLETYAPDEPHEIPYPGRDAYWADVAPYYAGTINREPGDQTDYRIGLFEDAAGRTMLFFERYC